MQTRTFTNNNGNIRVTIPESLFQSYLLSKSDLTHSRPTSKTTYIETAEQQAISAILSDAMRKLGNQSEFNLIKDKTVDEEEVFPVARRLLILDWLSEHSAYRDVITRFLGNHRLSLGMQRDVDSACAWADSQIKPLSHSERMTEAKAAGERLTDSETHNRRVNTLYQLRTTAVTDKGNEAIEEARNSLLSSINLEKDYRKHFANDEGWKIEIIGEMPEQIGMCRVVNLEAHVGK